MGARSWGGRPAGEGASLKRHLRLGWPLLYACKGGGGVRENVPYRWWWTLGFQSLVGVGVAGQRPPTPIAILGSLPLPPAIIRLGSSWATPFTQVSAASLADVDQSPPPAPRVTPTCEHCCQRDYLGGDREGTDRPRLMQGDGSRAILQKPLD